MIANNNYDELEIIKLGRWCGKWPVIKTHSAEICVPTHPSVETSSFNNIIINSRPFLLYHHEASLALGYHKSPEFHTWFHKMFKRNAWSLQKWGFESKITLQKHSNKCLSQPITTYLSSISEYFQNHNGADSASAVSGVLILRPEADTHWHMHLDRVTTDPEPSINQNRISSP